MPCSSFKFMFSVKISKTKSISQPLALSACIWCRIVSIRTAVSPLFMFRVLIIFCQDLLLVMMHLWLHGGPSMHDNISCSLKHFFRSIHPLILIRDNEWWHCWDISAPSGEEKDSVMENLIFPYIQLVSSSVCMHPYVNTSLPPRCWHFVVLSWQTVNIFDSYLFRICWSHFCSSMKVALHFIIVFT